MIFIFVYCITQKMFERMLDRLLPINPWYSVLNKQKGLNQGRNVDHMTI